LEVSHSNSAAVDEPLFEVVKEEPLEEGEISEGQTGAPEESSPSLHKKSLLLASHGSCNKTKLFKKPVLVNLAYRSTSEASSKKGQTRAFLKLPMKSSHKSKSRTDYCDKSAAPSKKRRLDDDNDHERRTRTTGKPVIVPGEASSSTAAAKNEPLEEGEIKENIQVQLLDVTNYVQPVQLPRRAEC
ncbi:hypothetical protein COOONC_07788, partial [Cooperia oncophora]